MKIIGKTIALNGAHGSLFCHQKPMSRNVFFNINTGVERIGKERYYLHFPDMIYNIRYAVVGDSFELLRFYVSSFDFEHFYHLPLPNIRAEKSVCLDANRYYIVEPTLDKLAQKTITKFWSSCFDIYDYTGNCRTMVLDNILKWDGSFESLCKNYISYLESWEKRQTNVLLNTLNMAKSTCFLEINASQAKAAIDKQK